MGRPFEDLEHELRIVEDIIAKLTQSDGFVEDLILLHSRRKRLLAAFLLRPERQRIKMFAFASGPNAGLRAHAEGDLDPLGASAIGNDSDFEAMWRKNRRS
jgi:hypothetical protein